LAKKSFIKGIIFDWAGTTIDYGCFAPVKVFQEIFKNKGVEITLEETRKPMGKMKKDHIRDLCSMPRIQKAWKNVYGKPPDENNVEELFQMFEQTLLTILSQFTDPISGVLETITNLKNVGLLIGSTTGYTQSMMHIVVPEARKKGYKPDSIVNSSDVPFGRPAPFMCYQNAMNLNIYPMSTLVKVGDTIADITEGLNAGMWSIGVIMGSSELGLTEQEVKQMNQEELQLLKFQVHQRFIQAGAHYVIDKITDLPKIIAEINKRMSFGDSPTFPKNSYKLLTPGPITTTSTVKLPMMTDWGSRSDDYKSLVEDVRKRLVRLATKHNNEYTAILIQGSGTYAIESVIGAAIPKSGKLFVIVNGAYGKRIVEMAKILHIPIIVYECNEMDIPDIAVVKQKLQEYPDITHVACIHSETTTGIINPIDKIAKIVKDEKKVFIVDAMSSFGAIPVDVGELDIDYLISSANKNIQGIPGFAFIIAKISDVKKCKGQAHSLSLDFYAQWEHMKHSPGSFRYTSPVHAIRAFKQALIELEIEGIDNRYQRYVNNQKTLVEGMKKLGFSPIPLGDNQGPIITTFYEPKSEKYDFNRFYNLLRHNGFVIYPGKLTKEKTFRIGTIGDINKTDIDHSLMLIKEIKFW
jgi:phosphonoacetaldehyde hydrolase